MLKRRAFMSLLGRGAIGVAVAPTFNLLQAPPAIPDMLWLELTTKYEIVDGNLEMLTSWDGGRTWGRTTIRLSKDKLAQVIQRERIPRRCTPGRLYPCPCECGALMIYPWNQPI